MQLESWLCDCVSNSFSSAEFKELIKPYAIQTPNPARYWTSEPVRFGRKLVAKPQPAQQQMSRTDADMRTMRPSVCTQKRKRDIQPTSGWRRRQSVVGRFCPIYSTYICLHATAGNNKHKRSRVPPHWADISMHEIYDMNNYNSCILSNHSMRHFVRRRWCRALVFVASPAKPSPGGQFRIYIESGKSKGTHGIWLLPSLVSCFVCMCLRTA